MQRIAVLRPCPDGDETKKYDCKLFQLTTKLILYAAFIEKSL
jgi:hypothetical protein